MLPSIERMHPGDHYCGIFRTDDDHRAIIVDFIRSGIERNEKMLYIVNVTSVEQLKATLSAAGIDVEGLLAKGQLVIVTAKDAYLKGGQFDPDRMLQSLEEETDKALAEGYSALRGTGEMTWALAGEPGSERLVEYESRVNEFAKTHKFYGLCQYDRRRFDAEMLLDILHTHPNVLFGREGFDNSQMYFVPPAAFMGRDRQSATLDTWLKNLSVKGADPV
ncbi:MAG: MEDS domain-containing protein [Kofleriaceae bacterium]